MARRKYSIETWEAIETDISNGMTFRAAAEKYDVPLGTVSEHIHRYRTKNSITPPKRPQKYKNARKCPCCGTTVDNPKARFCWKCGGDVRSEELQLIEGIEKLTELLAMFPSSQSEEGIQIANKLKAYLQRRG